MPAGNTIKTRKNALALATWDPLLLWYAKAVGVMKTRPITDPTSWKYQAAIHGFSLSPQLQAGVHWKQWTKNQTLPKAQEQATFWAQCQHGSWYFLPWHRMYLGFFERIVRKTVADLGGPADWALPYWNYNQGLASGKLPAAFTQAKLPDGSDNALLEPMRDSGNNGQPFLPATDVSLKAAFQDHQFGSSTNGAAAGFGGPVTKFHHSGGSHGALESKPHDLVHVDVGGLMGDPGTAAYDPIFWLHHANIDRLWEVWLKAAAANKNPAVSSKWQSFAFKFHDETGTAVSETPHDVLDTKTAPFYYQYDDVSVPASAGPVAPVAPAVVEHMAEEPVPEMVGASSKPTPLSSNRKTLEVRLFPTSSPMRALGVAEAHFRNAYLHVENIRGKGQPASYDVYLNVPEGAGAPPEKFQVGTIPTFGLEQASMATERHPGNGLRFTFNVTETVNLLIAEKKWDPEALQVTFVPRKKLGKGQSIEVGRVSLYYT